MRIALTGATGFVGRHLIPELEEAGHEVVAFTRDVDRAKQRLGESVEARQVDVYNADELRAGLAGCDAIVHLVGENIFGSRWSKGFKQTLRDSRVVPTRALYDALHEMPLEERPRICVSASAIGIYGSREPELDCRENEHDSVQFAPRDYLAHVCKEWEAAARRLEVLGVRTVRLRIGVVLGRGGGALERMEPIAKLSANLTLGNGRQMVSWIHVGDLARVISFALHRDELRGAVNGTAPNPVTNRELAKSLAQAMGKGSLGPALPSFVVRLMFGKGRASVLLGGARVLPYRLQELGFRYMFPTLDEALGDLYRERAGASMARA